MVLTTIYLTRHGFRVNWTLNPDTGKYHTNVQSPTKISSDPPLAAYGVEQAEQLAEALLNLHPKIDRFYSSPFYRCLQTIHPTIKKLQGSVEIRGDNGLGEWYGTARFDHPSPASPPLLQSLFPSYSLKYKPSIIPSVSGETLQELHDRCAYAMTHIITNLDQEEGAPEAILICTHAASLIAIGRALTGRMPESADDQDFNPYTCGLSKFTRKDIPGKGDHTGIEEWKRGAGIPRVDWRAGKGIAGGWDCVLNGDCSHLKAGAERNWHFSGDESFTTTSESDSAAIESAAVSGAESSSHPKGALGGNDTGAGSKL